MKAHQISEFLENGKLVDNESQRCKEVSLLTAFYSFQLDMQHKWKQQHPCDDNEKPVYLHGMSQQPKSVKPGFPLLFSVALLPTVVGDTEEW